MFIVFQETASISAHLRKKTTTAWLVACNNFVNLTITTRCAARPRVISQAGSRRSSPEDVTLVTRESYRTTSSRCWASRIKSSICKTWYRWTRIRCFWKKKKEKKRMHDLERVNAVNIMFYHVAEPVWYIIGQFSDHDLLKNPKEDFITCLQFGGYKHVFLDKSPSKFS